MPSMAGDGATTAPCPIEPFSRAARPLPSQANVRAGALHVRGAAPQLAGLQRWYALARYIADKILAFVPHTPIPAAAATG